MTQTKPCIIAGNWKMYKSVQEAVEFVKTIENKLAQQNPLIPAFMEIAVFPSFTSLHALSAICNRLKLGSQNIFFETEGAFTGEISPLMLKGLVDYVLIGHSERRHIFHESDQDLNKKLKTALVHQFKPMYCIGETLTEREQGNTLSVITDQIQKGFADISSADLQKVSIAYEPVWAIGTGKTATPEQAEEVHASIRNLLTDYVKNPQQIPILYGGSVKPDNISALMAKKNINGALIGGASLKPETFFAIIENSI